MIEKNSRYQVSRVCSFDKSFAEFKFLRSEDTYVLRRITFSFPLAPSVGKRVQFLCYRRETGQSVLSTIDVPRVELGLGYR